jgi:hypothetical protein
VEMLNPLTAPDPLTGYPPTVAAPWWV